MAPEQPKPVAAPLRGILRNDAPVVVSAFGGEKVEDVRVLWCFIVAVLQLQPPFSCGYTSMFPLRAFLKYPSFWE